MSNSSTPSLTLSNTQYEILEHAINDHGGQVIWFPDSVKGGARKKVLQGLFSKSLITHDDQDTWIVTPEGYVALGRDVPAPATPAPIPGPDSEIEAAVAAAEAQLVKGGAQENQAAAQRLLKVGVEGQPRTREHSKQAVVIQMLKRPEGASIRQICEATGWQAHTVRGTFAGALKKKLGLVLTSEKAQSGERVYRVA